MPRVDRFHPGAPTWVDLMTSDQDGAEAFYSAVFGWDVERGSEDVGGYAMCSTEGLPVAGIGKIPEGQPMPTSWTSYVATDDIGASVATAAESGGQVLVPATEVKDGDTVLGTFAMLADPAGAMFGLWQAGDNPGSSLVGEPGSFSWHEVMSSDAQATRGLLNAMFDYDTEQIGDGAEFDYVQFSIDDNPVLGVMAAGQEVLGGAPSHWRVYFAAADVDADVAKVIANGGSVIREPWDTPYGRLAVVADPQGGVFTLHKQQLPAGEA